MGTTPSILVCKCAQAGVLPRSVVEGLLAALSASGRPFQVVDDLCGLAAARDPGLADLAHAPVKIAACYPRAIKWLFSAAGASLDVAQTEVVNLRVMEGQGAIERLLAAEMQPNLGRITHNPPAVQGRGAAPLSAGSTIAGSAWKAWFPVIDFDRCNHCMQCLNFCLFGVFEVNADRRIAVTASENCKTNCPACSRVCPEAAIIFPKYANSPINGDEVATSDLNRESMKADLTSLLGGDLYSTLRRRRLPSNPRFSKERDPAQALKERQRYLSALGSLDEIPPEVVADLMRELGKSVPAAAGDPAAKVS